MSIMLCLALTAPAVACASDQSKKLQDAQTHEAESARESALQSADEANKSQEKAIDPQTDRAKRCRRAAGSARRHRVARQ